MSFKNKKSFFKKVDQLPAGARWVCDIINVEGDKAGPNGQPLTEELELWRRDPVECIAELIGNPAFAPFISFAPVIMQKGGMRYWGEMNTGDWWWTKQVSKPDYATMSPCTKHRK